jgi:hypothetical protein
MTIPEDTFTTVYCKICGKGMKTLGPHFKSHGITARDYQQMFPGAPTYSEEERLKACERAEKSNAKFKGQKRDPAIGAKVSATRKANCIPAWNKGIPISEEQRQKQSKTMSTRYASGEIVHWNTGNTTSEETKQKISEGTKGYKLTEEQRKRWEEAMIELRSDPNYVSSMKGKQHSEETRAKLSISAKRNAKRLTQEATNRVENHLSQYNINVISKNKKGYNLQCNICNTSFFRTNSVLVPYRYEIINGEYCPKCYPSKAGLTWSLTVFENNPELKSLPGELYIVRMSNENENFIKVGITSYSTQERWQNFKNYQVEILHTISTSIFEAFVLEQTILMEFCDKQYIPYENFGGKSECLQYNCLNEVLEFIRNYQQEEEMM